MSSGGRRGAAKKGQASRRPQPGSLGELDPEALVRACLAQAPGAWEEFLHRYADLIHSTLHVRVGLNEADREDAFQNAVLAIYTHIDRLRDHDRLVPWIIRIAYRQGVNRIRSRTRRRETPLDEIPDATLYDGREDRAEELPGEEAHAELIRAQRAQEALGMLPERCRNLLLLLFYADPPLDYGELSRRQGIPMGSIGPTRARCLERMRRIYERRGWDGPEP
jgi:RNA polymerase sigma factor (sigma-70 family)